MAKMLNENNEAFQEAVSKDFKTALEEKVFEVVAPLATIEFTKMQLKEWMKPISAMVPKALAASGHTAQVIREPYGVTLIIGPFNGPLTLVLDPAITAVGRKPLHPETCSVDPGYIYAASKTHSEVL